MVTSGGWWPERSRAAKGVAPSSLAEHEHLPHPRAAGRLDGLVQEWWDGEQVAGAGVVELGGELLDGVQGVDGGVGPAGQQHPVERDRVLGQVGEVDGEHLTGLEPPGGQAAGHQPGTANQLAVGDGAAAETVDQRRLVGPAGRVGEHQRRQRHLGDGDLRIRTPDDHGIHGLPPSTTPGRHLQEKSGTNSYGP